MIAEWRQHAPAATALRPTAVAAFAVSAGGISLLAADQGGFFPRSWPWAALAFAAAAAIAILSGIEARPSLAAVALVAALAVLAGWTALSAVWSSEPQASLQESVRTPVYVVAALALVLFAAAGESAALLAGLVAAATAVALYSLADRVLHGPHLADQQAAFLERPLGYANALGIFCAVALVVVVGLGVPARGRPAAVAVLVSVVVLGSALALSGSRSAGAACVVGLAVATATRLSRRRLAAAAAAGGGLVLAALTILAAFEIPARLQARGDYWHVAWRLVARHPLLGGGAGTFDLGWAVFGDLARWGGSLDAHSLYLETLAELGPLGLALLAPLVAPVVVGLRAARSSRVLAASLGGAVAFLLHAGLDWDWEMPAVTVAGLVCIAAVLGASGEPRRAGSRLRAGALALAVVSAVAYLGFLALR